MSRLRTLAPAVLLALVPLAACGDDDGGDGDALSKAEFIQEGDAICGGANEDGGSIEQPDLTDAEDMSRYLGEAAEVLDEARAAFEELDPPGDGEEAHDLEVQALRESVEVLEEAKAAADDGDATEARRIVTEADPEAEAREVLQDYGFEVCGSE